MMDQLGRDIHLLAPPKRIISLVPSQTELLYDLGLWEKVVGITRFCVHPWPLVKEKEKVGGTKDLQLDKILSLQPDLVIGNKEENTQEDIEALETHFPVWMSDVNDLTSALEMIRVIAQMCAVESEGQKMVEAIERQFAKLAPRTENPRTAAYFMWKNPYMLAAEETFIHAMLEVCGLENCLKGKSRYPEVDLTELLELQPNFLFLSSEPYPFKERDRVELQKRFPNSKVHLVDGELFSWYGSRLKKSPDYFINLLE